MMNCVYIK